MYIVTERKTKTILAVGNELECQQNGWPTLADKRLSFVGTQVDVHEVDELPEDVGMVTHCYSPSVGFYENPKLVDPEETIMQTAEYQAGYDQAVLDMMGV